MAKKYDGWVVKTIHGLLVWTFEQRRSDVIKHWGDSWKKARRSGEYKIVKVKLVEVED